MNDFTLDGACMTDMTEALKYLSASLPFLGALSDLDALWDALTAQESAVTIRLRHVDVMCAAAGGDGETLLGVLTDAASENPRVRVVWESDVPARASPPAGRVLLVNGSPHENGCTAEALQEMSAALAEEGFACDTLWVGAQPVRGCMGCGGCRRIGRCVFDDVVNQALSLAARADGMVFASPVHYAAASGALTSLMDRFFYAGGPFRGKPAAAVCVARRAGDVAALDQMHKYFYLSGMPIVTSQYWGGVYGTTPAQVRADEEGMQTLRLLARNMAWLIRCIKAGERAGVSVPEPEPRVMTNFIR